MSQDPAGLDSSDASNPQSLNRYAYALGDPVNMLDPFGLDVVGAEPGCSYSNTDSGVSVTCPAGGEGSRPPMGPCDYSINGVFVGANCGDEPLPPPGFTGPASTGPTVSPAPSTPTPTKPLNKPPACPIVALNSFISNFVGIPNVDISGAVTAGVLAKQTFWDAPNLVIPASRAARGMSTKQWLAAASKADAADAFGWGIVANIAISGAFALYDEHKAWKAGQCSTIWD